MQSKETFKYILTSYGLFSPSLKALKLYRERTGKEYPEDDRRDPVMVSIAEELGREADREGNYVRVRTFPMTFYRYLVPHYNQYECEDSVSIDYDHWLMNTVREVASRTSSTDEDKIREINEMYSMYDSRYK